MALSCRNGAAEEEEDGKRDSGDAIRAQLIEVVARAREDAHDRRGAVHEEEHEVDPSPRLGRCVREGRCNPSALGCSGRHTPRHRRRNQHAPTHRRRKYHKAHMLLAAEHDSDNANGDCGETHDEQKNGIFQDVGANGNELALQGHGGEGSERQPDGEGDALDALLHSERAGDADLDAHDAADTAVADLADLVHGKDATQDEGRPNEQPIACVLAVAHHDETESQAEDGNPHLVVFTIKMLLHVVRNVLENAFVDYGGTGVVVVSSGVVVVSFGVTRVGIVSSPFRLHLVMFGQRGRGYGDGRFLAEVLARHVLPQRRNVVPG